MDKVEKEKQYRDRLKKIIGTKIDTTMVYPLSQFEICFGDLWGKNKTDDELTEEEKNNRDKWEICRTKILNNGNRQKRNAYKELDMYSVIWNRYTAELVPIENKG